MIIAFCERCHGLWNVPDEEQPSLLQGVCLSCQAESDTEKPLTFGVLLGEDLGIEDLPEGSLA
jgi:hypothetical protein